jgi:hypothetical protein
VYENNLRNTKCIAENTEYHTSIAVGTVTSISGNTTNRPEVYIYNTEGHFQHVL